MSTKLLWKDYGTTNKIINKRPLIFLCGPYHDEKDKYDRRTILRRAIGDIKVKDKNIIIEPFALIVDNLFSDDENVNFSLLEEIIAACSFRTYIFIDTLSTALELGLFINSYSNNKVIVLIPSDHALFKPDIGIFVTKTLELSPNVSTITYKNKRKNKIINEDKKLKLLPHLISFKGNILPKEIKYNLSKELKIPLQNFIIKLEFSKEFQGFEFIQFTLQKSHILKFTLPTNLLLFLLNKFSKESDIKEFLIYSFKNHYKDEFNTAIRLFYLYQKKKINIELASYLHYSFKEVYNEVNYLINCIEKKVDNSQPTRYKKLLYDEMLESTNNNLVTPTALFNLSSEDIKLIKSYSTNPNKYTLKSKIVINGKLRNIISYRNNNLGFELKYFHKKLIKYLEEYTELNDNMYAYIKSKNIKDCVLKHKNDKYFLKIDIKEFFGSIKKRNWNKMIKYILMEENESIYSRVFPENNYYKKQHLKSHIIDQWENIENIFNPCFRNGKLPLGYSSSPLLSNIFMNQFDKIISTHYPELKYSRYADDILISSETTFNHIEVSDTITKELLRIGLEINKRKVKFYALDKIGNHAKFLGINIIRTKSGNKISLGKNKIKKLSLEISEYQKKECDNLYKKQKIIGKINYLKQINEDDYKYLCDLYFLKNGRKLNLK